MISHILTFLAGTQCALGGVAIVVGKPSEGFFILAVLALLSAYVHRRVA